MSMDNAVPGFRNRWYGEAVRRAVTHVLSRGTSIRLLSAPVFIVSRREAFAGRGHGEFRASHDLGDITSIVEGRPELGDRATDASADGRGYLGRQVKT